MLKDYREKVVAITGASSGIGREMALLLSENSAKLSLFSRRKEKLEETKKLCEKNGAEVIITAGDVGEKKDCERFIMNTLDKYGKIDVLINNAGITMYSLFEEIQDISVAEKIVKTNLLGSIYCTFYALKPIIQSHGLIIAVSSLTGKTGVPTRTIYSATKHAIDGFFSSLRIELKKYGVGVTVAFPGFVRTDIRKNAIGKNGKPIGESHINEKKAKDPRECSKKILEHAIKRKREVLPGFKEKIMLFIKFVFPSLIDKIAEKSVKKESPPLSHPQGSQKI